MGDEHGRSAAFFICADHGNAAGAGAQLAVLNVNEERSSAEMAAAVKFVELANDPEFQDVYVDQMFFGEQ